MEALSGLLTVAAVSTLAVISPGPDFFIVLKNSLTYSRRAGFFTAFGIALALLIHLTYTIVGIGSLMSEGSFFYILLKYVGAAYLFYIGLKGLLSSFKKPSTLNVNYALSSGTLSNARALRQGFLTNLLNPKCALFFISFFSQFIASDTSTALKIKYGLVNWAISLIWFLFLSYLITGKSIISKIDTYRMYIERVMCILLMLLGLKLFF